MTVNKNEKCRTGLRRRLQFEIFKGVVRSDGVFEKHRLVGLGFLREGKHEYKFKLFPLLGMNYFIRPVDTSTGTYKVLVREEIQSNKRAARTYWSEVGDAVVIGSQGLMKIKIDLTSEPVYMNIFPREINVGSGAGKLGELKLVV
jgi:hypothetical protein